MRHLKNIILSVILGALTFSVTGCATAEGFGKDLQHVGKKIQHSAERHE